MSIVSEIFIKTSWNFQRKLLEFNVANSDRLADRLDQEIGVDLVRCLVERHLLPQVGCEESVGLGDGGVSGLGEVTESRGGATALSVAVLNTSHLQKLLGNRGADDAGTAWSWDQLDQNRAALASDLLGDSVEIRLVQE